MKKILPLLVVSILVLGGLGAVAIPEEQATPEPLLQPEIKIGIKGEWLGYLVTVTNIGNETINGSINMSITTDAWFMILGSSYSPPEWQIDLNPDETTGLILRPIIGFGPATINVQGIFMPGGWGFGGNTTGFALLFFVVCGLMTPPWE